jgi:hypothetical protein
MRLTTPFAAVLLLGATAALAQPPVPQPGPEHDVLKRQHGINGYDSAKKAYVSVWASTMDTSLGVGEMYLPADAPQPFMTITYKKRK